MFLNMDQLKKKIDKEEFQEIESVAAFKYFLEYTQLEIQEFRDTLIQHMEYVMKLIDKRALHKREYDSWAVGQNQESRIQAADQRMMHMLPIYDEEPMAE
ncbi:hypothetical protein Tco_0063558, partial [Tanacetum coccineum]